MDRHRQTTTVGSPEPARTKVPADPVGNPEHANPKGAITPIGSSELIEQASGSVASEVPTGKSDQGELQSSRPNSEQAVSRTRDLGSEQAVPNAFYEAAGYPDRQARNIDLEHLTNDRTTAPEASGGQSHGVLKVDVRPSEDSELRKVPWREEHRPLAVNGNHRLGEALLMLLRCDRELCPPVERVVPVKDEVGVSRRLSQLVVPSDLQTGSRPATPSFGPWSIDKAALEILLSSPPEVAHTCPLLAEESFKPLILGGMQGHVCVITHDLKVRSFRSGQTVQDLRRQLGQPKRSIATLCRCSRHWKVVAGDTVVGDGFVGIVWFLQNQ